MKISIIVPCYNSGPMLKKNVDELRDVLLQESSVDYQIILINDGSKDNTFQVIQELCAKDNKIIGIDLANNFGQETAKVVGLRYVTGEYAIFMDDDGQHPPQKIWELIDKIEEGYDIVFARFPEKKHSFFKRMMSSINAKVLRLAGIGKRGVVLTSYYIISSLCINAAKRYRSPFPNIESYFMKVTVNVTNINMEHRERQYGKTTYSCSKILKAVFCVLTNFSMFPIQMTTLCGSALAFVGFIYMIYLVVRKCIFAEVMAGYTSIMVALLIIGGMMMISIGMIGEYVGRTYLSISNLPQGVIRTEINIE